MSTSENVDTKQFQIQQRRYIGNKNKLMPWIKLLIAENTKGDTFFDVFAGTGSVTNAVVDDFDNFVINDFLYSNEQSFYAFFGTEEVDWDKLTRYKDEFNGIDHREKDDTYFVDNFGGRFFSQVDAMKIGEIRERIEQASDLNRRERAILITSLVYSADHIANTVGHYDAYRKRDDIEDRFHFDVIKPVDMTGKNVTIYRADANEVVKDVNADVVFLDPPYNSRQYSRFYHVLENITKWKKPELHGVAMKPDAENMSDYSRKAAPEVFDDLIQNIHGKYIVVTYNNTYENAKSSSSRNRITHEQIMDSLNKVGETKVFSQGYRFFNAGHTDLAEHEEFVFITEVRNG